ncbi:MAG TPA: Dam family site-specific DNA-(adenine-N6)-methyltransferase [Trueperaceae bacterium]|nr:Dam family site-specific DNA-(adenine-N6)-methyltransferase [Trueperaceae bacterium]
MDKTTSHSEKQAGPFLKWPGGKRWFVTNHRELLPRTFNRYIEPFLGAGAVFFYLRPQSATLGDTNAELITTYQAVRDDWKGITRLLSHHQARHCKAYYYKVRGSSPTNPLELAARAIYLNRTCFNGIYRVNKQGQFNVPIGTKDRVLLDTDAFDAVSELLADTELLASDFQPLIDEAEEGDLIFADPPYTVSHNLNGFIKYNERLFSWQDQERLARSLAEARDRGALVVATNANHPSLRALYAKYDFEIETVSRFSSISAKPKMRKQYEELVVLATQ